VAGRPVQFFAIPGGHRAVVPLPLEQEPGALAVEVLREGEPPARAALEIAPGDFAEKRLRVSDRYVRPPPPKVQARMEADQRAFDRAFAQAESPPLFAAGFAWPREDEVTGRFGDRRTLNGKKQSRHHGLDLGGATGAPVAATNAGRVVLVRDCWASGLSVVLFHGAGLFSTYYHLSKALVREGDEVQRGQQIGLVGKSGRVTGPHLHWGVKVAGLYVDPESVLRLPFGDGVASPASAAGSAAGPQ
jgi:murein DD-endopeptidase MepM/ murein hydrolase activator NlpD